MLLPLQLRSKKHNSRREWQHLALVAGFLSGRHFVGTKDLHYGYWQEGMEQTISNLPSAQEEYSTHLMHHIPWTAKRVLDVGSGAGSLAQKLVTRGHEVDCVSPCHFLNQQARRLLGDRVRLFDCRYEDLESPGLYDAIVFCESFQYVEMATALAKAAWQLGTGGRLIICDFFRKEIQGKSPISGGHGLHAFQKTIARFPFRPVREIDITSQTAPTFTVIDDMFNEVLHPVWNEATTAFGQTHPVWAACAKWWFRNRIAKFERKYFSSTRTAAMFEKFKSYRLMVFERTL